MPSLNLEDDFYYFGCGKNERGEIIARGEGKYVAVK